MTLRRAIASNEYYHIFNRGAHRHTLFRDKNDWLRFLFLILYCQSPMLLPHTKRMVTSSALAEGFPVPLEKQTEIIARRTVGLTAFCVLSNHFHLLLRQTEEVGVSRYMHRVIMGYTNYFNTKYKTSGHLFQGRYRDVHVSTNEQLLYLSAYIHRNPRDLAQWRGREEEYPYSSLSDYTNKNRWGGILETDILASQFKEDHSYRDFVRTSTAKSFKETLPPASLEFVS